MSKNNTPYFCPHLRQILTTIECGSVIKNVHISYSEKFIEWSAVRNLRQQTIKTSEQNALFAQERRRSVSRWCWQSACRNWATSVRYSSIPEWRSVEPIIVSDLFSLQQLLPAIACHTSNFWRVYILARHYVSTLVFLTLVFHKVE